MYQIEIKQTRQIRKTIGKKWEKLGEVEKPRDRQFIENASDKKTYISDEMGYTPEVETVVDETAVVYTQAVENLNLAEVILAVNRIPRGT